MDVLAGMKEPLQYCKTCNNDYKPEYFMSARRSRHYKQCAYCRAGHRKAGLRPNSEAARRTRGIESMGGDFTSGNLLRLPLV